MLEDVEDLTDDLLLELMLDEAGFSLELEELDFSLDFGALDFTLAWLEMGTLPIEDIGTVISLDLDELTELFITITDIWLDDDGTVSLLEKLLAEETGVGVDDVVAEDTLGLLLDGMLSILLDWPPPTPPAPPQA